MWTSRVILPWFTLMITSSGIPSRVIPQGSPWCQTHRYFGYYDLTLKHDTKDGSALRGTRASLCEVMCIRVYLKGTRDLNTRRGRAFLALAASPRDGATGSHRS